MKPTDIHSGLTAERVRELFEYSPETGEFRWRVATGSASVGKVAGYNSPSGYVYIRADRSSYLAHRLAWLHGYGEWPEHGIDHVNGDRRDNRLSNLRSITQLENTQNQIKAHRDNRSTGLLGTSSTKKKGRYRAMIAVRGKDHHLGTFDTPEEAHAAYLAAKRELHAGCTI